MSEDWTKEWERRVVNGVYPLRRFLGRSGHSVVFLTECPAQNLPQAAIKILPAKPGLADAQLAYWRAAASLSHPHLMRLLETGRCQLGGHNFLFVVMDHAEQTLAQILPGRPLVTEEVRELLPPTLDALAYLHRKNLAHGGLKPPNLLVVGDQLKLSSDTIRPAGERTASTARPSPYEAPELKGGRASSAGDIWALGMTLIEALTQKPLAWARDRPENLSLPESLDPEYADILRQCLDRDPDRRPNVVQWVARGEPSAASSAATAPAPPSPPTPAPPGPSTSPSPTPSAASATPPPAPIPPVTPRAPSPSRAAQSPKSIAPPASAAISPGASETAPATGSSPPLPKARLIVVTTTLCIVALWLLWSGVHLYRTPPSAVAPTPNPPSVPRAAPPPVPVANPGASSAPPPAVIHQEMPEVSARARASVRGIIKVTVRVIVDGSGKVVAQTFDKRGSSRYFSRSAMDAAQRWQFAPAAGRSRVWLLEFDFTRDGTTAHASPLP